MPPLKPKGRPVPQFVNHRGEPVDPHAPAARPRGWPFEAEDRPGPAPAPAPPARAAAQSPELSEADLQRVLDALCLAGWRRGRTSLVALLRRLDWRRGGGPYFSGDDVGRALRTLAARGQVQAAEGEGWSAAPAARLERLPALLRQRPAPPWWHAVAEAMASLSHPGRGEPSVHVSRTPQEAAALTLLLLAAGTGPALYDRLLLRSYGGWMGGAETVRAAMLDLQALDGVELADPALWWGLLDSLERAGQLAAAPALLSWAERHLEGAPAGQGAALHLRVAERRLHAGDLAGMRAALGAAGGGSPLAPYLPVLEAAALARQGRWADAAAAFVPALKALAAAAGRRTGLLPRSLAQWYLLALLAQSDAKAWTQARRFAVSQSGARQPQPAGWGLWAHAVAVRLGDSALQEAALAPLPAAHWSVVSASDRADALLLAAWLGRRPAGWNAAAVAEVARGLRSEGLHWKADLLAQACERLGLPVPARPADAPPAWCAAFYGEPQAAWRDALAAIAALGGAQGAGAAAAPAGLRWLLRLDAWGRPLQLQALEPSASGRGRPRPLSEGQLRRRTRLDVHDAAVARCLRSSRWSEREVTLDLAAAVPALVGHPALALADAPDSAVELVETLPVLQVQRQRDAAGSEHFVFRLDDDLLCEQPLDLTHHLAMDADARAEAERRGALRVLRESATRARLLRITPAQRRVAELVSQRWSVPVQARDEMDAALRVLAGHFVLHSDAEAGEPVPSDARLVALLQPRGNDLQLQLAVRPFGEHGPLLAPGQGRVRLMTVRQGVTLATERALDAERAHFAQVLQALPFLGDAPPDADWLLDDPEQALTAVQALGELAAGGAAAPLRSIEWPRGRSLKVLAPPPGAFASTLRSGRDWFALHGELRLDEQRVLSLQATLALLREHAGRRFLPLGQGEYLALTAQLRQRLADLDALAQEPPPARGGEPGLRLAAAAAAWLADAADELGLRGDTAWRGRAQRLEEAAALQPVLPPGLQAQLRPYQVDGVSWMQRLAHAGLGACLADDMGLGKTVQTLALLLQRAALGPALVVAPTSVCRNWADEAARFAPGLRVSVYGQDAPAEGHRAAQLPALAAGEVLVASYGLLMRDAEAFAAPTWATLVLDEAQALKNAATQRVKAVAALQADFRLALSGTPVENRLADLWSLMNLLNPGLLGSAQRFGERFAGPIERQRDAAARARLRRLVGPFLLRRTKAQVLTDLPPRTEIVQQVEPGAEERAFLEAARRSALQRVAALVPGDSGSAFNVLAELTRLRRAACDPRLAAPELGLVGAKVQAFERLAQELVDSGHQALVFSQFTDFLDLLGQRLQDAGLSHLRLDGSTPAAQRAQRVAAFQRGDAALFLISLKAGGYGLNLTAADYVVIADPWWNPAAEDQAMGRAHRIGQQRPVTVYRLVTAGSVEERIVALHRDKRELAEGLLAEQDGSAPLRAEELLELLRG